MAHPRGKAAAETGSAITRKALLHPLCDEGGHVGFGTGKAREVPLAIKKAVEAAKKS